MGKAQANWIHWQAAIKVADILHKNNFQAYLIGGSVRDILLGHLPKDFDLVTDAKPRDILKLKNIGRSFYKDTAQAYGVTRVRAQVEVDGEKHESEIEIATFRKDLETHLGRKLTKVEFASLEEDVQRRDLTINALALDPSTNQLFDLAEGLVDLQLGVINFIGNAHERIKEDPLRILRAIRLKNQLGFTYNDDTRAGIEKATQQGFVEKIATDRARQELTKMFKHPSRETALVDLDTFGILEILLPELVELKGLKQPKMYHAEGDTWEHTLLAMQYLPDEVSDRLAWATLLHDIGKAKTQEMPEETGDRIRFSSHSEVGSKMAGDVLARLNFSKKMTDDISWMVYYHIGIDTVSQMRPMRRKHFMSHDAFEDLLELHRADAHSSFTHEGKTIDASEADFSVIEKLYAEFEKDRDNPPPSLKRDLGVSGNWVMEEMGLKTGPELGQIMHELEEAYLDHEIESVEDAKKFLRNQKN